MTFRHSIYPLLHVRSIIHVHLDFRQLDVLAQRHIYALGAVLLHLVMAVHLLGRLAEQEDHLGRIFSLRKRLQCLLFVQVMRRGLKANLRITSVFKKL